MTQTVPNNWHVARAPVLQGTGPYSKKKSKEVAGSLDLDSTSQLFSSTKTVKESEGIDKHSAQKWQFKGKQNPILLF